MQTLTARTGADLLAKVRKNEGWTKCEGGDAKDVRRMTKLYTVQATRDGRLIATRKAANAD